MTSQRARRPSYNELTAKRSPAMQAFGAETRRLIGMKPKAVIEVTPEDGDLTRERNRWTSRMRTARLETGRRYRCLTLDGRLYVVCEEEPQAASTSESDR